MLPILLALAVVVQEPVVVEPAAAQAADEAGVRGAHERFWSAFNACDRPAMAAGFTDDAEFYHDRTGLTTPGSAVARSMAEGPCADVAAKRLHRVEADGAAEFFPLAGGYAMLEGRQRFTVSLHGGPERHDSVARYVEVWRHEAGTWRMRRIVSYDHRPDLPVLAERPLPPSERRSLPGRYAAPDGTAILVTDSGHGLSLASGRSVFPLVPLGGGRFGTPERWLTFAFSGGTVSVIEEGTVVAKAARVGR